MSAPVGDGPPGSMGGEGEGSCPSSGNSRDDELWVVQNFMDQSVHEGEAMEGERHVIDHDGLTTTVPGIQDSRSGTLLSSTAPSHGSIVTLCLGGLACVPMAS